MLLSERDREGERYTEGERERKILPRWRARGRAYAVRRRERVKYRGSLCRVLVRFCYSIIPQFGGSDCPDGAFCTRPVLLQPCFLAHSRLLASNSSPVRRKELWRALFRVATPRDHSPAGRAGRWVCPRSRWRDTLQTCRRGWGVPRRLAGATLSHPATVEIATKGLKLFCCCCCCSLQRAHHGYDFARLCVAVNLYKDAIRYKTTHHTPLFKQA